MIEQKIDARMYGIKIAIYSSVNRERVWMISISTTYSLKHSTAQ